jgi:hypothetical protein
MVYSEPKPFWCRFQFDQHNEKCFSLVLNTSCFAVLLYFITLSESYLGNFQILFSHWTCVAASAPCHPKTEKLTGRPKIITLIDEFFFSMETGGASPYWLKYIKERESLPNKSTA